MKWTLEYGSVFRFRILDLNCYMITDPTLVQHVMSTKHTNYGKGPLKEIKEIAGEGLFTTTDNELWHRQHQMIKPAFHWNALKNLVDIMLEKTNSLVKKWEWNIAQELPIFDILTDITKLTLDIIGKAGFGYEFKFVANKKSEKFLHELLHLFEEIQHRIRMPFLKYLPRIENYRFRKGMKHLNHLVDSVIQHRKKDEKNELHDLLTLMLNATDEDPITAAKYGSKMAETQLRDEVITFLLAGHETTTNLLTWTLYLLSQYPEVEQKVLKEIKDVMANNQPTIENLSKLQYLGQVINESLRLYPPVPILARDVIEDDIVGGYRIPKGGIVFISSYILHHHPNLWKDPESFNPDRFSQEGPIHPYSFIPFGAGPRSCIGMNFAVLETKIVLSVLLSRFQFSLLAGHKVVPVQRLSLRPKYGMKMVLKSRIDNSIPFQLSETQSLKGETNQADKEVMKKISSSINEKPLQNLVILYGSQSGTAEGYSHQLADEGFAHNFNATAIDLADYDADSFAQESLVIIITATYNGEPPQDAVKFYNWLHGENRTKGDLKLVKYTVFGVGNKRWIWTYQKVPKAVYQRMQDLGATPFFQLGAGDADGNMEDEFISWKNKMWESLTNGQDEQKPNIHEEHKCSCKVLMGKSCKTCQSDCVPADERLFMESDPLAVQSSTLTYAKVVVNKELQVSSERSTRHVEFDIENTGITYEAGDHVGIYAENDPEIVQEFAKRLNIDLNEEFAIQSADMPEGTDLQWLGFPMPCTFQTTFSRYLSLTSFPNKTLLSALARYAINKEEKHFLDEISSREGESKYLEWIIQSQRTIVDVLKELPSVHPPIDVIMEFLPRMQPRLYSISSSPKVHPSRIHITVSVVNFKTSTGRIHRGVCSSYLSRLVVSTNNNSNDVPRVPVFVSKSNFRLPKEPLSPIIMVGAGTGIAPFRAFIQERQFIKQQGGKIGDAHLFFGCRMKQVDYIYQDDLEKAVADDVISQLHVAFSREQVISSLY